MAKNLILKETKTSIILEIPKALIKRAGSSVSENAVLKLVNLGRKEYAQKKTKTFNSVKELLARA